MSKKLILAASFLLASCGTGEQPNIPAPGNGNSTVVEVIKKEAVATASVQNTKWVYPKALKNSEITLNFAEGKVSGSSGCNLFMGEYTQTGSVLNITPLVSTRRACADNDLQAQEQDFLNQLNKVNSVSQANGSLILSGEQDIKLTFKAATVESISNTQWKYKHTETNGTVISSVLPETSLSLNFSETQATGSAGCNSFVGEYAQNGEYLSFKNMASTEKSCLNTSIMEQESVYLKHLGNVKRMQVEDKMLMLHDDQNTTLVFEASSL